MNDRKEFYQKDGTLLGWVVDDALMSHVCETLIEISKGKLKKSPTMPPEIEGYRTSSSAFLNENSLDELQLKNIVQNQIQIDSSHFESIHIAHYKDGERYKKHHDCFHEIDEEQEKRGGQRTWTALFYLSDVEDGGETLFPNIDFQVMPAKGRMVIWKNTDENYKRIEDSVHESLPTTNCEKWVATIWVRQNPFVLDPNKKDEDEDKNLPGIGEQAKNLTKAIAKRATSGFSNASFPQYVERLNYCMHCEYQQDGRCTDCGCFLAKKAMWASEDCPKGKWPKLE